MAQAKHLWGCQPTGIEREIKLLGSRKGTLSRKKKKKMFWKQESLKWALISWHSNTQVWGKQSDMGVLLHCGNEGCLKVLQSNFSLWIFFFFLRCSIENSVPLWVGETCFSIKGSWCADELEFSMKMFIPPHQHQAFRGYYVKVQIASQAGDK